MHGSVVERAAAEVSFVPLSAPTAPSLRALAARWSRELPPEAMVAEIAGAASAHATRHAHRAVILSRSRAELRDALEALASGAQHRALFTGLVTSGSTPRPVFVFSGQGCQWLGMGRGLFRSEPVFREAVVRYDHLHLRHARWSIEEELFKSDDSSRIEDVAFGQPAIFAIQAGLVALWRSWGIVPCAVVGHSMGEVAAAHAAGVLGWEEAVRVVEEAVRAVFVDGRRTAGAADRGLLASVELSELEARRRIGPWEEEVWIAGQNSPASAVIAGAAERVRALCGQLERDGVFCRLLPVDCALHSPMVAPYEEDFHAALEGLQPRAGDVPMYSTVTGDRIEGLRLDAGYWRRNLREPVQFLSAVRKAAEDPNAVFIEVSPHPVLSRAMVQTLSAGRPVLPSLRRSREERATLLESLAQLHVRGASLNWSAVCPQQARPMTLPTADAREASEAWGVELEEAGTLDGVSLRPRARRALAPDEVEIEVLAAGLNFRDVLKILGTYPSEESAPVLLGDECSGRVVRLGPAVRGLAEGEEVIAVAAGSLASHVCSPSALVVRKPSALTFTEAATLPIAFLTAAYALEHLARLRAGERVLIHCATGGVGSLAVQLARRAGAEIFATAGSEEKRTLLRAAGIAHVMDSRSLDFAEQVIERTGGQGVDVVLNCLSGDVIDRGLAALAPFGRFIELGKKDIYADRPMGLGPFRRNLSYFAFDLQGLIDRRPDVCRSLLVELCERVDREEIAPPFHRALPASEVRAAVRSMAQSRHVGKLVLTPDGPEARVEAPAERSSAGSSFAEALIGAATPADKRGTLEQQIRADVVGALGIPADRIDPRRPLHDYGADSLLLVDLATRLRRSTGVTLSPSALFAHPSVEAIAGLLASALGVEGQDAVAVSSSVPTSAEAENIVRLLRAVAVTSEVPAGSDARPVERDG